ncbi:F-box only protein 42-like [Phymastichus coffea]|uniref:F-box only protein 42-like n=1 Tax=Phymastichus coffea TaxID=108790 RepID=UPI00273C5DEA|nr:F-box only protein 42-like [Phymastichus coffea]
MERKIDDLPDEILEYILSLIPPYKDLQECMFVSKRWFQATKNVIEHSKAHFQKSIALGSLFWNSDSDAAWGQTIAKRHSHSACTYENSMYVFGGCTATSTTFNDLWKLDLDTRKWERPTTMGSYPSPKACATMLYYKKNFILFGGWSHPSPYPLHQQWKLFNELHVYCIESNRWIAINALETPPPTSAHSASIHDNLMVVFGGVVNGYSSNEVWRLNLDTYCWQKQVTSNLKPQPRYGQSQIPIDDKHLLVLGGCTGPNVAMNDAWLLTIEDPIWTWKKINMRHTEAAPTRIWCHQACKVGNHIIVLSKRKRQSQPSGMSISVGKPANPSNNPQTLSRDRQRSLREIDRDENVNGRRGYLQRSAFRNAPSSTSNSPNVPVYDSNLSMAAFRDEPVRNNSAAIRQIQLEFLRRAEERLQSRKAQAKVSRKNESTLAIYILDISNVLCDECSASWVPIRHNQETGPDERILYSLVLGRGELIVFGGIRQELNTVQGQTEIDASQVYNDLHFINPPKYVI